MCDTTLIYPEYFQTVRDYISMMQNFSIILITAGAFLLYKFSKINRHFKLILCLAVVFGAASIIIGLYDFGNILDHLLEGKIDLDNIKLIYVGRYLAQQFWLNFAALMLVGIFGARIIFWPVTKK